ncbi:MAG: hypothetical protein AB1505_35725 [Candidatus Latescibacterota bacterium]
MKKPRLLLTAAGLGLAAGYLLLGVGPPEGACSRTLAPLLLVAAYCGLVPAAILTLGAPLAGQTGPHAAADG